MPRESRSQPSASSDTVFQSVFEALGEAILVLDAAGSILHVNAACCELLGRTRQSLVSTSLAHLVADAERPLLAALLSQARRGSARRSLRFHLSTRDPFTVLVSASPLSGTPGSGAPVPASTVIVLTPLIEPAAGSPPDGAVPLDGSIAASRVVEDILPLHDETGHPREWLQVILSSIGEGIIATDVDGRIRFVNRVASILTGWSEQEAWGRSLGDVFRVIDGPSREPVEDMHRLVFQEGRIVHIGNSLVLVGRDGSETPVDDSGAPIRNARGELVGVAVVFRDVTERRHLEQQVLEAHAVLERRVRERTRDLAAANSRLRELDRIKSEFLATMSHEIRTPLNSILGFTGLILEGMSGEINNEQRKQLNLVYGSGRHLLDLISDFLNIARIESGRIQAEFSDFDLRLVVSQAADSLCPLAARKGIEINLDAMRGAPVVRSDARMVTQILLNLVGNAVRFTEKGTISVSCQVVDSMVEVSVADTGIGIPRHSMDRLFQPFQQIDVPHRRVQEGTGLGLYLCRKLVELLGGHIRAESEYGRGSVFTFALPLRREDLAEEAPEAPDVLRGDRTPGQRPASDATTGASDATSQPSSEKMT